MAKVSVPYCESQDIELSVTGINYSDILDYSNYESAQQVELKVDVTAGDGSLTVTIEVSDDQISWFKLPSATDTLAGVDKGGVYVSATGKYMRAELDYTHTAINTVAKISLLAR